MVVVRTPSPSSCQAPPARARIFASVLPAKVMWKLVPLLLSRSVPPLIGVLRPLLVPPQLPSWPHPVDRQGTFLGPQRRCRNLQSRTRTSSSSTMTGTLMLHTTMRHTSILLLKGTNKEKRPNHLHCLRKSKGVSSLSSPLHPVPAHVRTQVFY